MRSLAQNAHNDPTTFNSAGPSTSSVDREDLYLAERVEHALRATGYAQLRGIQVTVHARLVILAGRVPSYHLKQIAQATALAIPGAHQVCNDLHVCRSV